MPKKYEMSIGTSLPKPFMEMIDEIVKKNPDFKNRTAVIRYAVRKYYEYLKSLKLGRLPKGSLLSRFSKRTQLVLHKYAPVFLGCFLSA